MKKTLIIVIDLIIMMLILFFIIQYANTKMRESNESVIAAFEKMTVTAEQIITNYLEDEQHLCDIWANYINRSAQAGEPMTMEEAIAFIRKAKLYPTIYGHLIIPDNPEKSGISTHAASKDPDDYSVSYRNINLFDKIDKISREDGVVSLTRAYTNPQNGVQSIAFMNFVTILDESTGKTKEALLMRVEPVSVLEDKFVFLKGEYENVEISLINKDGDYLVHGKSLKNSNFFEFYKSYNKADIADYNNMIDKVTTQSGTMRVMNSKGEECVISYTPLTSMETWSLLTYIPAVELEATNTVVDWLLLGMVTLGLMILLGFNYLVLKLYNKKLAEAAEAANQANEAKSHFLSTMSHDIRTPMNAILGLNEMVLRNSREEEIVEYSESIRTAGKTLLGIINDILDFSKIEAGKMDIITVDYNFVSMLNDLVNMVQGKADDKGLAFILDVDRNIPMILHGDEIRIKQIITNILSNAVKYTKEGSVTFKIGYEKVEEASDAIKLIITISDTGIGIKPEDMKRLFASFERIEENKNRNIEGTGLGMSIAQSFLAMMGSHMEVKSEYGKGSTFSFELVQGVKDFTPIGNYEETFKRGVLERKKYHESFTAPKARVLVVDDTPVNLSVFKNLLKRTKVQIDAAGSGDEGISLFREKQYDVIFLDHMMPDKDGIETLKEMKEITDTKNAKTPVICLTANAISGMREMYINESFDDYITKPIDPDSLEAMLLEYLPKDKISSASGEGAGEDHHIPEFIWGLEEIDVNTGLLYCGGSENYMFTLNAYLDDAKKNADEIEKYWKAGDIKNTTVKVHGLKSTSRMIGAMELGDFAQRLETAGDKGDRDTLEKEMDDLLNMYRKLAKDLEPLSDEKDERVKEDKPLISVQNMEERVVVVDDDAIILRSANTVLSEAGFKVTCLKSGRLLLDYVTKNTIDMLLLDIKMPELDGFETMRLLRKWEIENKVKEIPVIFFTANDDCEAETKGLSLGAMDFIRKPFAAEVLTLRVRHLLDLIRLQRDLHAEVERKTKEIEGMSLHVVQTLADAIDAKDAYTKGHSGRVADYSREIAKRAGYSFERQEEIYMMGLLHDVGKIGVPDAVINKPGKLTDEEFEKIKTHPGRGAKILKNIEEIPKLFIGARWHHERYDGKGYPDGLSGEEIPEEARIIAVADAYDAMTSNRSYRGLTPQDVVKAELEKGSGTQFDPRFAAIMLEIVNEDVDYKLHEQ